MTHCLRKMTIDDVPGAADALADAFLDDPGFKYFVPLEGDRRRWLPVAFGELLYLTLPNGCAYMIEDESGRVLGAMSATPPGKFPHPWWRSVRMFWRVFWRPRPWCPPVRRYWPLLRYLRAAQKMHPKIPHWFGEVVGVRPDCRDNDVGKTLGEIILDLAGQDGYPIYFVTGTDTNVEMYEAFGFEVTGRYDPPDGGPYICGMMGSGRVSAG